MRVLTKETVYHLVGLLLSLVAIYGGIFSDFADELIPDSTLRVMVSFLLSVYVIIVADKLSFLARDKALCRIIFHVDKHISTFPKANLIRDFISSNAAMEYLCNRIPHASQVYNTRISRDAIPPSRDLDDRYYNAITSGISNGLSYKEIISSGFKKRAESLEAFANRHSGNYYYTEVLFEAPCFMNFIIIEYPHGEKEVIFGWATSRVHGTEQKAFKIIDERVIDYYLLFWHSLKN